jgi:predicted nuclease of predicted toxin-antitoxin system
VIFWLDAQLPPDLASWLAHVFRVEARSPQKLGLRDAEDRVVFEQARAAAAVLIIKNSDFVELV